METEVATVSPITLIDIATLIVIVAGPAIGVWLARHIDDRRLKHERRLDVFRTLMATRQLVINPEHVRALNLVEVEFHDKTNVISAWREYLASLDQNLAPEAPREEVDRLTRDRDTKLAKLLHAMSTVVGIKVEQLDIYHGGYAPQGWVDTEARQRYIQHYLLEVLQGRRTLAVTNVVGPAPGHPFPPPPPAQPSTNL